MGRFGVPGVSMASSNGNAASPLYSNRAYALAYAKRGWPVVPCHEAYGDKVCSCGRNPCKQAGKHPRTRHGLKDATTDAAQINAWWTDTPDAPIAIVCGDSQDLLVIDIDPRNGGDKTWEELQLEHGPIATMRVRTGGGGEHLYLRAPKRPIKSKGDALGPGVDVSSNGHYIIAPPSMHESGSRYEFFPGAGPADIELAECPEWVHEAEARAAGKKRKRGADRTRSVDTRGWLAVAFDAAGRLGRWNADTGAWFARCPWEHEHSDGRGDGEDSSTVVFPPTADRTMGWFHCSHAHCSGRTLDEVRRVLPDAAKAEADKVYPRKSKGKGPAPHEAKQPPPPHDPETGEVRDPAGDPPQPTTSEPSTDWRADLTRKPDGTYVACLANVVTILAHDERWVSVLAYDEFSDRIVFQRPAPWHPDDAPSSPSRTIEDEDATRLSTWLHRYWGVKVGPELCWQAIQVAAKRATINPPRSYLLDLGWDGVRRVQSWMVTYLGAADTTYHRTIGLRWLVSAVARVLQPGCKADSMLILEGEQGTFKSSALRALATADWYCDEVGDIRNKDSADALRGKWIVEMGELSGIRRADVEAQKAFLSRAVDHYRAAYARTARDVPRRCVFAGTTNSDTYHSDPTGLRRFWAVRCGVIDLEAITRDRDQLWAEAVALYQGGAPWWLQADEVPDQVAEQDKRREVDPWTHEVAIWCESTCRPITIEGILEEALKLDMSRKDIKEARRVGAILKTIGYIQRGFTGPKNARVKTWVRKEQP